MLVHSTQPVKASHKCERIASFLPTLVCGCAVTSVLSTVLTHLQQQTVTLDSKPKKSSP